MKGTSHRAQLKPLQGPQGTTRGGRPDMDPGDKNGSCCQDGAWRRVGGVHGHTGGLGGCLPSPTRNHLRLGSGVGTPLGLMGGGLPKGCPNDVIGIPANINTPHKRTHVRAYGGPSLLSSLPAEELRHDLLGLIPWSSNPPFAFWFRNIPSRTNTAERWDQLSQGRGPHARSPCSSEHGAANVLAQDCSLF